MTTLTNSAEGGTNGTTVTAANSGGASGNAFDVVTIGANATDIYDNTHAAHGTLSYKFATGASSVTVFNRWSTSMGSTVSQTWFRVYVYLTANPASLFKIILFSTSGGSTCATLNISTTGKVQFANGGGSTILTSTNSVNLNGWTRIEGFVIGSSTVGQLEFKVFLTPDAVTPDETQTSAATQNTTGTMGLWSYGIVGAGASQGPYWADDLGLSNTGYIGPAVTTLGTPVRPVIAVPAAPPRRRAVIVAPRLLPAVRPALIIGPAVIPRPRPRPRAAVTGPRSLLASPVPPVPGKPVLIAPVQLRPRPRGRAVVVQFTPAPSVQPGPVTGRTVIPPSRPKSRGVAIIPVRTIAPAPIRVVMADDGDAPWHIRVRRRRT